jgi:hypothetical protein
MKTDVPTRDKRRWVVPPRQRLQLVQENPSRLG